MGVKIEEITRETTDEDFKGKPAHRCWSLTGYFQGRTGKEGSSRRRPSHINPSKKPPSPGKGFKIKLLILPAEFKPPGVEGSSAQPQGLMRNRGDLPEWGIPDSSGQP